VSKRPFFEQKEMKLLAHPPITPKYLSLGSDRKRTGAPSSRSMLFVVQPSRRFVETLFALVAEQLWKEGDDPQDLSPVSLSRK
jgi:hypothetical protein